MGLIFWSEIINNSPLEVLRGLLREVCGTAILYLVVEYISNWESHEVQYFEARIQLYTFNLCMMLTTYVADSSTPVSLYQAF